MQIIQNIIDKNHLTDNKIFGSCEMNNSQIVFNGHNNICFFGQGVKLQNSKLNFNGDNSIVYFAGECEVCIEVGLFNGCVFSMGKNCSMRNALHIIISEWTNVCVGDDVMISLEFWCRTADPHLIYDSSSKKRINTSQSVYIGDHVWIGQEVMILKGTQIGSGSIIGAKSLVAGKKIKSNTIYAGNPAKLIREDVFYDRDCVHDWTVEKTEQNARNDDLSYIYTKDDSSIIFDEIDYLLRYEKDVNCKLEMIKNMYESKSQNRFAK